MKKLLVLAAMAVMMLLFVGTTPVAAKSKMPKDGQTFKSSTFKKKVGKKTGYWEVKVEDGVTKYRPVCETDKAIYYFGTMYVKIGKKTYYLGEDNAISWENPDGYQVSKYGWIIFPKEKSSDPVTTPKPTPVTTPEPTPAKTSYTVKKIGDAYRCVDENGNWQTGFIDGYYFGDYGMAIGLTLIGNDWYYFSEDLADFGKMKKSFWRGNSQYFGADGKAIRDQKVTIGGKTYRFNSSGFIVTGWYNDEFYSGEPDRYGQLIPDIKK